METVCGKQSGSRCVLIMVRDVFLKTSMKIVALFHNKPVCYIYGREVWNQQSLVADPENS